jgi:hypothetical protein
MKSTIVLALLLVATTCATEMSAAPRIDFWSGEGDFLLCDLEIPAGESRAWFIVAHPNDLGGMDGAEFRVTGWPAGYVHTVTANPAAAVAIGDPLGNGCNIALGSCETSETVLLYTVQTFNPGSAPSGSFAIEQHAFPSNPNFQCPVVMNTFCSPPLNTTACASAGIAFLNQSAGTPPSNPSPADAAIGVALDAQLSWDAGHPGNQCAIGIPSHRVYFGSSADPPLVGEVDPLSNTVFDPGALLPNTTYHWRIEAIDTGFGISGPVWSFTTTTSVAVEDLGWSLIKEMYR